MIAENSLFTFAFEAGTNLPEAGRFVEISPAGVVYASAGSFVAGVLLNTPKRGEMAMICAFGVVRVRAASQIRRGQPVCSAAQGYVRETERGAYTAGIALDSGTAGMMLPILLCRPGYERL